MSERRRLRAGQAPVVTDGEMPVALSKFRVIDWLDDDDDDWTTRSVRARRRWATIRDRWLLDHGQYRGRWVRERGWEHLGWADLERHDPVLAARLRVPDDSYDPEVVP